MAFESFDDYEDYLLGNSENEEEIIESNEEEDTIIDEQSYEDDEDLVSAVLRQRGINPDSIKIETDNGIEELKFNELSREELLDILGDQNIHVDNQLADDEVEMLKIMRQNHWTSKEYNNYIAQQAIEQYKQENNEVKYSIDDYSDEELFVADLQTRIPDITQEEALAELQAAKNNESLFSRRMNSLRNEYKQREQSELDYQKLQEEQKIAEQYNQFKDTILQTIELNREIDLGGLPMEMSDDDMNAIASFILDSDQAGVRYIQKALQDPNAIVQMAWWLTRGQEAFREMNNYYKQQISQVAKNNYNKGLASANPSGKAVVRKNNKTQKAPVTDGDLWDKFI